MRRGLQSGLKRAARCAAWAGLTKITTGNFSRLGKKSRPGSRASYAVKAMGEKTQTPKSQAALHLNPAWMWNTGLRHRGQQRDPSQQLRREQPAVLVVKTSYQKSPFFSKKHYSTNINRDHSRSQPLDITRPHPKSHNVLPYQLIPLAATHMNQTSH